MTDPLRNWGLYRSASVRTAALFYFLAFLLLAVSLFPALHTSFAHHDDFGLFDRNWENQRIYLETALGRPFFAIFDDILVFPLVRSLNDIVYVRWLIVVVLAGSFTLLAFFLYRRGLSFILAFLAASLVFLLPGFQQRVFHSISLAAVIAILLALAAGVMTSSLHFTRWGGRDIRALVVALAMLAVSAYTYLPSTMFFVVALTADLLFRRDQCFVERGVRFATAGMAFATFLVFTVVLHKFVILPLLLKVNAEFGHGYGSGYVVAVSDAIPNRIREFLFDWLPLEARLWWLEWPPASLAIAALLFVGMAAFVVRQTAFERSAGSVVVAELSIVIFLVFGAIVFVNAPSIISDSGGAFSRTMLPASALITLLTFWICYRAFGPSPYFTVGAVTLSGLALFSAFHRLDGTVRTTSTEFELVRTAASELAATRDPFKELVIVSPTPGISYFGDVPFKDEFYSLNSHDSGEIRVMFKAVLSGAQTGPRFANLHFVWDPQYRQSWYNSDELWYVYAERQDRMRSRRAFICDSNDAFLIYHSAAVLNFADPKLYLDPHDGCRPTFIRIEGASLDAFVRNGKRVRFDFLLLPNDTPGRAIAQESFAVQFVRNNYYAISPAMGALDAAKAPASLLATCVATSHCFVAQSLDELDALVAKHEGSSSAR